MFLFRSHFAEGCIVALRPEYGVVAESGGAAWRPDDLAFDFAAIIIGFAIRPGKADNRNEPAAAIPGCARALFLQCLLDLPHAVSEVTLAVRKFGPIGGIDTGIAAQRINA